MKSSLARSLYCLGLAALVAHAQSVPTNTPDAAANLKTLTDALKIRAEMADRIASRVESHEVALGRLRSTPSPSGQKVDPDADLAFAAMDVGLRLVVANKPDAALKFFQEAEASLTVTIAKTPDKKAREKSEYLAARANVRARFLNKPAAAQTDIDAALLLQPDSPYLQQVRANLVAGRGEYFKSTPKG